MRSPYQIPTEKHSLRVSSSTAIAKNFPPSPTPTHNCAGTYSPYFSYARDHANAYSPCLIYTIHDASTHVPRVSFGSELAMHHSSH